MAEYYVIKDKNTGLYFRGKGVNRWGKYYNQATIYKVKGAVANTAWEISKSGNGEEPEIVPIKIFEDADVVQVVRCKDCIEAIQSTAHDDYFDCLLYGTSNHKDYYCAEGERKDNG